MPSEQDSIAFHLIEDITRNAARVQEKVLKEILSQNGETEYLQRFKLGGKTDPETFKCKVPVIEYEDIRHDIQRIANGDQSPILTTVPISEFFLSCVPSLDKGKALHFLFIIPEMRTPGGFIAQNVMSKYFKSKHFKNQYSERNTIYTSPIEAIFCIDHFQSMYVQMLCGLYERKQVNRIGAGFASGLLRAIRFLQLHWKDLIHDIRTGFLNPKVTDPQILNCMVQILKPDPELADFVSNECSKENWQGIIPRIWPNTKYLDAIITGTMAQYTTMVNFYGGGLPIISSMYACSECCFGLNLSPLSKPSNISYTIMPNLAYFEFIPHKPNSSNCCPTSPPKLVDLVDVEIGKEYEIVVTTYAGLYRYQIGDVLRVTGFHNFSPQFEFVKRKNVLLSIDADKTDEAELQNAVIKSSKLLNQFDATLIDYTSRVDTKAIPGHYVIYWELLAEDSTRAFDDDLLRQCSLVIEDSLSFVYRKLRTVNLIGSLEIRVLKNGTFQELMEHAISRGASVSQYKVPRCVKSSAVVDLLDSRVISSHFSPSLPHQKEIG